MSTRWCSRNEGVRRRREGFLPAILVSLLVTAAGQGVAQRPNIVFILADDLGYGDVGIYGGERIATPHIDRLAKEGVRLTAGYVSHPVCSPSRAGLLTGRYQQRHGWEFNTAGIDRRLGMALDQKTLADHLRAAGYATGMVGKWHLGQPAEYHPERRGFDEFFGILEGGTMYIDSRQPGVEYGSLAGESGPTERGNILRGTEVVEVEEYLTEVFTDEALSFIERHRDEPFFLYLSHIAPHTPLQATAEYLERYRHLEDQRSRVYAAMVAALDDSVGAVLTKLDELGLRDDTLVVFASDNGCADYILGACSNRPLEGFKRYHHEGGIRVPFILSWPRGLPAGSVYEEPVISLDLLATFTAAAGKPVITEDSVDLLPFLRGEREEPPHRYLYWRSGPTLAIRDQRFKLMRYNLSDRSLDELQLPSRRLPPGDDDTTARLGQLTLLYDLDADPGESRNVAAEHPEVVQRLGGAVEAWAKELAEPLYPPRRSTLAEVEGKVVRLFF